MRNCSNPPFINPLPQVSEISTLGDAFRSLVLTFRQSDVYMTARLHLSKFQSATIKLFEIWPSPARGHWYCDHWHLIGSSQNVGVEAKCFVSLMSGLLSARVHLGDMTNSIFEIPEAGVQLPVTSNTALVCMTVCTSVRKRLHTLPSHATFSPKISGF